MPSCLVYIYVVSKNCIEENLFSTCLTFAFRSIESLCWIISNSYSETKNQRLGIVKPGMQYLFTTILHHITNATSSKPKLCKTKGATIL